MVVLVGAREASAQSVTGNIYGRVVNEQGAPLPGVGATLTGVGAPLTATTTEGGEFRFLNLSPGEYKVTAALSGFSTAERPNIVVHSRQNAEIELTLKIAALAESVVVTGEPPILDTRKLNVGINVTRQELEAIPTARDPWVILQRVPGVQTDRVNVGGSESGQQSYLVGKGSPSSQTEWIFEGIVFQSMSTASAVGTSPLYYDFDSLQEIHVSTGGTDPSTQTPGVQVNLITKRGTNSLRGTARIFIASENWEATNIPDELRLQLAAHGASIASGNSIDTTQDYGAEIGGALLVDRLWLWGAYGRNQINLITTGGYTDDTTLENIDAKLNAQLVKNNAATLFYYRGDKVKLGRDVGLNRPPETSWDQTGPASAFKIEDSHVFNGNLFATVIGSHKDFAWGLVPEGSGQMRQDSSQTFHNTYFTAAYDWPDSQVGANMSYFLRTGRLSHELKVGGLYRFTNNSTRQIFEGNVVACNQNASWCPGRAEPAAELNRDSVVDVNLYQYSGYISDTLTIPRLTVNLGLRYDYQYGVNNPLLVEGSRAAEMAVRARLRPTLTLVPRPRLPLERLAAARRRDVLPRQRPENARPGELRSLCQPAVCGADRTV